MAKKTLSLVRLGIEEEEDAQENHSTTADVNDERFIDEALALSHGQGPFTVPGIWASHRMSYH